MEWTCRKEKYYHNGWIVEPSTEGWVIFRPQFKELGRMERADKKTYTSSAIAMFAAEKLMSMKKPETEDDEEWELV